MTKTSSKKLSRRDAIKLLGAAVGASVLANLPSKWSTPELASGVLPAHAQTSVQLFSLVCQEDQISEGTTPTPATVVITPAQAGISMTWTVAPAGSFGVLTYGAFSGTVLTDASGLATIDFNTVPGYTFDPFPVPFGGVIELTWSFTDPALRDPTSLTGCNQFLGWSIPL